jgi:lysophospholipase L1-like esterase
MSLSLKHTLACASAGIVLALSISLASAERPTASREPDVRAAPAAAACTAPAELARLSRSLNRSAEKILARQALTIVAIGSSSTYGAGASTPDMSYPSRLAVELQALVPHSPTTVLNRGVNGETTADMLARFGSQVFAAKPDLVIWQVGSNALLQGLPIGPGAALLRQGLHRLTAAGIDVIVMDPQYAPAIIEHDADAMVSMIDAAAGEARVNLFHRFAVMRHWRLAEQRPFSAFVSDDDLHMNDWSYGCIATLLAGAIDDAARRTAFRAAVQPRS